MQEAAVIGVKDEKWGERPMAFVVRKSDAKVDADAVRAHLLALVESNRISKYAVPEIDRIAFVAEIPKTSVGKIDRRCCASATRDDGGAPPRWPLRPWRSPSCTNCEPAATNLRQSPVATR
ncbi:MAG TPA: hypothetical protein VF874_00160 [Mycobacterium sp.]